MLYELARPLLFSLDPESAHNFTLQSLHLAGKLLPAGQPQAADPVEVMGLQFPNRIGLAAGLDKNGEALDGLARLGFGFIEIGTITPRPQPGNPRPRMFRLPEVRGIINRMGFNNHGVDALIAHVRAAKFRGILGINIGKNFDTPIEHAADDYLACLEKVYALASYVTVNISSPNTKNLRQLQGESELDDLLGRLKAAQKALVMSEFAEGRLDVLVATTVIEVGVDVPNATLMVIEHAERFGLAQLHQLRGRVGRGAAESTCILLYAQPLSPTARARLKVIYENADGFVIAREDLKIRGPGEFVGARQSGVPLLRYADLEADATLIEPARALAQRLLAESPEHALRLVERWLGGREGLLRA